MVWPSPRLRPRWLIAGTAALAGIIAGTVVLLALGGGDSQRPADSFYLEAMVLVEGNEPHGTTETRIRWWFRDPHHYRYQLVVTPGDAAATTYIVVADGEYLWRDSSDQPAYHRDALSELPPGAAVSLPISILLGPAPAPTMGDLLRELLSRGDPERRHERFARVVGKERVLGVETQVVEFGPTWHSSGGSADASGNRQTFEESGGSARIWVDVERMFILRYEEDVGDQGRARADVVDLKYGARIDDGVFRFEPPPGKTLDTRPATDNQTPARATPANAPR